MTGQFEVAGEGEDDGPVGLGELAGLSVRGGWRLLAAAVRHGQPVGGVALACVSAYGYLVRSTGQR